MFWACSPAWIGRQPPKHEFTPYRDPFYCDEKTLDKFMNFLEIKGVNTRWMIEIKRILNAFLIETKWIINEDNTLEYLLKLRNNNSRNFYRKKVSYKISSPR